MVGPWIAFIPPLVRVISGGDEMSDIQFLAIKKFDGKLFKELSVEFSGNATQITHIVPNNKTFYLARVKLYPVVNTIFFSGTPNAIVNRRTDIEINFDGALVDVVTFDEESRTGNQGNGAGAAQAGQFDSNIIDSIDGDGIKTVTLVSTNTVGTYRVSLIGWEEDTGTSPQIPAI